MEADCSFSADPPQQTPLDQRCGAVMFWLTVVWLALVGTGLHLLSDMAVSGAITGTATSATGDAASAGAERDAEGSVAAGVNAPGRFHGPAVLCLFASVALLPLYWIEWLAHRRAGGRRSRRDWQAALFPPLRIGARDHVEGRTLWLPGLGWARATDDLEVRLERQLGVPMIVVALLVLPVIALEFLCADRIARHPGLALMTHLAGTAIWLAFAVEFLVQVSVVRDRWRYVRRHWLDLAIVCLPLLGFLRILRIGRLLRLHQLATVSRTARVYRMRGLAMRVWRAMLLLEAVDRWLNRDEVQRLQKLRSRLATAQEEVQQLQTEIDRLQQKLAAEAPEDGTRPECGPEGGQ